MLFWNIILKISTVIKKKVIKKLKNNNEKT